MISGVNIMKHLRRQEKYREVIGGVKVEKHLTRQEKYRETSNKAREVWINIMKHLRI